MEAKYIHKERVLEEAKNMDDVYLIIKDWEMKTSIETKVFRDHITNDQYVDYGTVRSTSLRLIGTERQLYLFFCYKLETEAWELRDTYEVDWDEFAQSKQDWYKRLYLKNRREPVVIKLIN